MLFYAVGCVMLVVLALAVAGESEALIAWCLALILLLPPLLWALKTRYVALITISLMACATQLITLPFFYLNRDDFAWGHVKPYQFTGLEALPMLLKVFLFLILLNLIFGIFYKVVSIGGSPRIIDNLNHNITSLSTTGLNFRNKLYNRVSSGIYTLMLILIVMSLTPLNLWMFSQGISIVGVEPPALPYRLSGILHYFTKYITPLVLVYIYFKTRRGWLPMSLMLGYAWIIGLSSVSRSSLIFIILPVIYFAWIDRRKIILTVATFIAVIGYAAVTNARSFVYTMTDGKIMGEFSNGVFRILSDILYNPELFLSIKTVAITLVNIFGRIDGFDNLVMSQYYDSSQVSGPSAIAIGVIWQGLLPINLDAHHIQWQGNTLPVGFVNGGGVLSNIVILGNAGWWWIAFSAILAAMPLVMLEKSVKRLSVKYQLQKLSINSIVGFLSISFFSGAAGSTYFVYPVVLLFLLSLLPRLTSRNLGKIEDSKFQ